MPRKARIKSQTGIYHIILRGINRQNIFEDNEDKEKLLYTLIRYKSKCKYEIFAYCLMDNHVHLLLKEGEEPLEQIMRRLCGSYVFWYNKKYDRIGNLFQDRFKSEPVETEKYFFTVIRYIHQNPLMAGITKCIDEYRWSSYKEYIGTSRLIDKGYVMKKLDSNYDLAHDYFVRFNNESCKSQVLEFSEKKKKISDEEVKIIIRSHFSIDACSLQNETRNIKEEILKKTLALDGITTRQLARVTGVSVNTIWNL